MKNIVLTQPIINSSDKICDQASSQVRNQVWNHRNQVWNQLRNQVWNQVGNQVLQKIWSKSIYGQVRAQVDSQVIQQIWSKKWKPN